MRCELPAALATLAALTALQCGQYWSHHTQPTATPLLSTLVSPLGCTAPSSARPTRCNQIPLAVSNTAASPAQLLRASVCTSWTSERTAAGMVRPGLPRRRMQQLATLLVVSAVAVGALSLETAQGVSAGADGAVDAGATAAAASTSDATTSSATTSPGVAASPGAGVDPGKGGDGKVVKLTDGNFKAEIARGGVVFVKFFVSDCYGRVSCLVGVVVYVSWTSSRGLFADVKQPA